MSPWLWVAIFIVLIIAIDRFVIGKISIDLSEGEINKHHRWSTLVFILGVATLLFNLRLQQGAANAISSLSQYMVPLLTLGLVLIALGIIRSRSRSVETLTEPAQVSLSSKTASPSLSRKQIGMLGFSLFLVIVAIIAAGSERITRFPSFISISLWLAAMLSSFAAGWDRSERIRINRKRILIAAALFLFALSVRISYLGQIPNPMYGDEGSFGASAVEFITGESNNIFTSSWFQFPSLYFFLQSFPIRLFGNTVFAIRLWSGLVGSLTVVGLYFLGRQMFNERIGLIAGLLLASHPLHIEFSRIGLNNIWDALSFTLVLGSLWFAWKHNSRNAFLALGFFWGISQYFYASGRLLIVLVPVWLVILAYGVRTEWKFRVPHLLFGATTSLVTALPIIWYYLTHLGEYFGVLSRASLWESVPLTNVGPVWNSIFRGFMGYTHIPLTLYFVSGEPMLRLRPALFFLLGILFMLQRPYGLRFGILASWLFAFSVTSGLSSNAPAAQRMIAATPAVNLIAAYGLVATAKHLQNQWPKIKRISLALPAMLTLWIATNDLRFYFFEHTPRWDNGIIGEIGFRLGLHTQDFPSDTQVILFPLPKMEYHHLLALKYLAPQVKGITMESPWGSLENPDVNGEHLIFVFTARYEDSLKAVQEDYPQGKLIYETYRNDKTVYWLYEVGTPSQ